MTLADAPTGNRDGETKPEAVDATDSTTDAAVSEVSEDVKEKPSPTLEFSYPKRPDFGTDGRAIVLRANYFAVDMPPVKINHYAVTIEPHANKAISRRIINSMVFNFAKSFQPYNPVFDGRNNLYSKKPLPLVNDPLELEVSLPNEDWKYKVTISWKSEILAGGLPHQATDINAVYATDCILRQFPSMKYFALGRSFYSSPGPDALGVPSRGIDNRLGGGKEMWFGYHQEVRQTQNSIMINMDSTITSFHQDGPVLDYLSSFLELSMDALTIKGIVSDAQRVRFMREVKSLKVEVSYQNNTRRKYKVCGVTRRTALTQTFFIEHVTGEREETTVARYYLNRYGIELQYVHLPLLQVGKEERQTYIPIELCSIIKGQRNLKRLGDVQTSLMIKASTKSALERSQEISCLMENVRGERDIYVEQFGIKINPKMVEFQGRVLSAPRLLYANTNSSRDPARRGFHSIAPVSGVWDMRGKKLHGGVEVHTWALVCFSTPESITENDLRAFVTDVQKTSKDTGVPFINTPCFCKYANGVEQVEPMFRYLQTSFPTIQMVVVILPGKTCVYAEVKKIGDTVLGIPTQCVAAKNVRNRTAQTISNICLKVNVKVGGINTVLMPAIRPNIFAEPVIFIGCDLNHPSNGSNDRKPSVAAMVASMDAHPSRYAATVRLQIDRTEIIQKTTEMIKELLIKFRKCTNFKPQRIVLYRGGVSEGQYYNALQYELRAIRMACQLLEVDYHPAITYITVSKHHHTRLFATDEKDHTGRAHNVPPGTIADKYICHPTYFDFFLCSHAGIQGTSRPSHYHVLWDDSKLKSDDLQQLTYQLCHTYARCTRAVSIPAPVYYARLVAQRARYHMVDNSVTQTESSFVASSKSTSESESGVSFAGMTKQIQVHPEFSQTMYFC